MPILTAAAKFYAHVINNLFLLVNLQEGNLSTVDKYYRYLEIFYSDNQPILSRNNCDTVLNFKLLRTASNMVVIFVAASVDCK